MKDRRFAFLIITLVMAAVWLGACGDETAAPTETPPPSSDEEAPISSGAGPQYPFPQHVVYISGTKSPDYVSQEDQDRAVQEAYVAWKSTYLKDDCGPGLYYVWTQNATGGGNRSISTSEGHGYGMIIMALMAGYDPEAQPIFDGLYQFFRDHPSVNSPDLMAWLQTEDCEDLEPGNTSSAVDGDMDIAYALLLADRQWGSDGTINYRAEAIRVIDAILAHEIHPETSLIMLGDWVTSDEPGYYYSTRSSDFMPGHLKAFYEATGDDVWLDVLDNSYSLYEDIQAQYSPETGLLPDFIQDTQDNPRPADPYFLEDKTDGWYYYNACRTPWRIGVDVLLSGDPRGKRILEHMDSWLQQETDGDPTMIYAGYELDGSTGRDYEYTDIAFVAPFGVGAMGGVGNQQWVNELSDFIMTYHADDESYFDSTLRLMSIIVMSGNWWEP